MTRGIVRRKTWLVLLGAAGGLLLLVIVLRRADLRQSWAILARIKGPAVFTPLAVTLGCLSLRGWRWWATFSPAEHTGFWACLRVIVVGNMANQILPGRTGDLLRCSLIARGQPTGHGGAALATLAIEKVLDGLVAVVIVLASSAAFAWPHWVVRLELAAAILFGGALLALLGFRSLSSWRVARRLRPLLDRLEPWALGRRVRVLAGAFVKALGSIDSLWRIAGLVGLTLAIWAGEGALVWGLARAVGIPLAFVPATVVSAVVGLGLSVPAAPASLGTYELFCVAGLSLFSVSMEAAVALALLMHVWVIVTTVVLGLLGLGLEPVRLFAPRFLRAR